MLAWPAPAQPKVLHPDYLLKRGEVQRYGDWLVGCDNQAACTVIGFPKLKVPQPGEPALAEMGLRISLSGSFDPALSVAIFPLGGPPKSATFGAANPFTLSPPGKGQTAPRRFGYATTALHEDEAGAALGKLVRGEPMLGYSARSGQPIVRFPGDQFARAYRAMQARREHLLKDLANRAIDRLPEKQHRIAAIPQIVSGYMPILAAKTCGGSITWDLRRYSFANGPELWSYACKDAEDPTRTFWQMSWQADQPTKPLSLPDPRDGAVHAGTRGLENAVFDFDFGVLREYRFKKGRQDCGIFRAWGFTQGGWRLLERREMPLCKGLSPNDWIRTHYSPADGAGPDE